MNWFYYEWFFRVKFNRLMVLKILVFIMTFSFIVGVFLASTTINLNKFQNNFMSPTTLLASLFKHHFKRDKKQNPVVILLNSRPIRGQYELFNEPDSQWEASIGLSSAGSQSNSDQHKWTGGETQRDIEEDTWESLCRVVCLLRCRRKSVAGCRSII